MFTFLVSDNENICFFLVDKYIRFSNFFTPPGRPNGPTTAAANSFSKSANLLPKSAANIPEPAVNLSKSATKSVPECAGRFPKHWRL